MQTKWQKIRYYGSAFAGYLFLWIVMGNLLGYVLSEHLYYVFYPDELLIKDDMERWELKHEKCYPASNYGYLANCQNIIARWFWIIIVTIPSFIMIRFNLNIILFYAQTIYDVLFYLKDLIILSAIIFIPAIRYWFKRNKKIAYLLSLLFFGWIIYFNLSEFNKLVFI